MIANLIIIASPIILMGLAIIVAGEL